MREAPTDNSAPAETERPASTQLEDHIPWDESRGSGAMSEVALLGGMTLIVLLVLAATVVTYLTP